MFRTEFQYIEIGLFEYGLLTIMIISSTFEGGGGGRKGEKKVLNREGDITGNKKTGKKQTRVKVPFLCFGPEQ